MSFDMYPFRRERVHDNQNETVIPAVTPTPGRIPGEPSQNTPGPAVAPNPTRTRRCGCCTVACMSGAMNLKGFKNEQILAEVDAICR